MFEIPSIGIPPTLPRPRKPRKAKTERIESTLLELLAGENVEGLLATLSEEEMDLLNALTEEIRTGKHNDSVDLDELWKMDYIQKPPTMEEFITDEYWLGQTLAPSETNAGIFPCWRDVLLRDFDLDSRVHNVVITGSLGTGKCWDGDERVLMFGGKSKKVRHVKPGDLLMGDDSTPRKVLKTCYGTDDMYKIVADDNGDSYTVNSVHKLVLKDKLTGSVEEIEVKDYLKKDRAYKARMLGFRAAVDYPSKPIKIDPYFLGLWLGDGSSNGPFLTISEDDPEILEFYRNYCASFGLDIEPTYDSRSNKSVLWKPVRKHRGTCALRQEEADLIGVEIDRSGRTLRKITPKERSKILAYRHKKFGTRAYLGKDNALFSLLREYGLSGPTNGKRGEKYSLSRKFIPLDYMTNSREVRLQLLAGLLDSDGCRTSNCGYGIALKNDGLLRQVKQLARSLGFYVSSRMVAKTAKKGGKPCLSTSLYIGQTEEIPCQVARKLAVSEPRNKPLGYSFRVIPTGLGKYYGFMTDSNHRILLANTSVNSNTYIMCALFLYRIVCATLLRNPQNFFGLSKGSSIIYSVLSVSKSVVTETAFGDAQNFMGNSPYFLEELHFDPDSKYTNFRVELKNGIYLTAGSKGHHILGRNAMGVALDEGNFRLEANPDEKAYKLYDEVRTRISNRFQKVAGFLPAISILASSARDESSFTEKVIKEIETAKDPQTQKIYRFPVYRARRHLLKLKPRWFKVAHGLRNLIPFIMSGWYKEDGTPIEDPEAKHEVAPKGAQTELIPEDYLDAFKRNPAIALQNIAGISTGGSHLFFHSTMDLERCIELGEKDGLVNTATVDHISISVEDNKNIWDYLTHSKFLTRRSSIVQAIRHPEAVRYAHLDLATQSMAGLAVCHLVGKQLVEGLTNNLGQVFSEYRLIVEYDFILTIIAGRNKPISLEKVQNLFFWLRDVCHYKFGLVTADQFQSEMPLQMMESRGFKVDKLSVDRKKDQYHAWRTGFEELRIRMPRSYQMMREAEKLLDTPDKIDHPPEGSKDTTDAAAGAYWNAIMMAQEATASGGNNNPSIYGNSATEEVGTNRPPIYIPLPASERRPAIFYA